MRALSDDFYAKAEEIMARYPTRRSAILMLFHEAQDEIGFVSDEVMEEIAELLDLSTADVAGVVTFYTMFKRTHPGQYLISLCTNPGCAFFGAEETAGALRELVGPAHTTAEDVSWEEVECLAYCSAAPACQVNYRDLPHLTPDRARRLVEMLRSGRPLDEVISELTRDATLPEVSSA